MHNVELYTDGSCLGNPGPGGWAAILKLGEHEKCISGGERETTNNRMELLAVINGLSELKFKCNVSITTDSQYVINAFIKGWIYNWEKERFKDRKNADLWVQLLGLFRQHEVQFKWIKGHAGHHYNERCDKAAQAQAYKYKY